MIVLGCPSFYLECVKTSVSQKLRTDHKSKSLSLNITAVFLHIRLGRLCITVCYEPVECVFTCRSPLVECLVWRLYN